MTFSHPPFSTTRVPDDISIQIAALPVLDRHTAHINPSMQHCRSATMLHGGIDVCSVSSSRTPTSTHDHSTYWLTAALTSKIMIIPHTG